MSVRAISRRMGGLYGRLVLFAVLTLGPAVLLLGLTIATEQQHIDAVAEYTAQQTAQRAALTLQQRIDGAHDVLVTLATLYEAGLLDGPDCDARLAAIQAQQQAYARRYSILGVIQPDGLLVCDSVVSTLPLDLSDRAHVARPLASGQFAVGDFIVGRGSGQPSLNVSLPVLDEQGNVRMLVSAGLDF